MRLFALFLILPSCAMDPKLTSSSFKEENDRVSISSTYSWGNNFDEESSNHEVSKLDPTFEIWSKKQKNYKEMHEKNNLQNHTASAQLEYGVVF